VVFSIVAATRLSNGLPLPAHWATQPFQHLALLVALAFGIAMVIFGIGWLWGAELSGASLLGRSVWGRRIEVPLASVTEVRPVSVEGLPALLVLSGANNPQVHIFTLGLDVREVHQRLHGAAGPANPLTQWFANQLP
jgi:hypothetical protein